MKEKILETLKAMGFELEDMEGFGYGFHYEGTHLLYMYNEDDEDFLTFALPALLEIDDEDDVLYYQVMDKINRTLKYVKANKFSGSIWLFYERELLGNEDMQLVLSHMIFHLDEAMNFFNRAMKNSVEEEDTASDMTDDDLENDDDE